MLFINEGDQRTLDNIMTWELGDKKLTDKLLERREYDDVFTVQASDEELQFISDNFSNIKMTTARVVIWEGEDARFILTNLKMILQNS